MTGHVLFLEEIEKKKEKKMTIGKNCPSFTTARHISRKKTWRCLQRHDQQNGRFSLRMASHTPPKESGHNEFTC